MRYSLGASAPGSRTAGLLSLRFGLLATANGCAVNWVAVMSAQQPTQSVLIVFELSGPKLLLPPFNKENVTLTSKKSYDFKFI